MTLFMLAAQRILPQWQQYALPPEKLTEKFVRRIGLRKQMDKPQLLIASLVSHLGFGATVGAIYGPLTRIVPLPSVLKGIVFGIVVLLASRPSV
jgi:putative membrane protein